jgi:hypothetical protein
MVAGPVIWLLLAACSLPLAAHAATCTELGDALLEKEQWQAAVQAYTNCSLQHNDTGPEAALSQYMVYTVQFWHLHDTAAAAAACKAGWDAYNAPELAWCHSCMLYHMQQHEAAKHWAEQSIAQGCFQGSCRVLSKAIPEASFYGVDYGAWKGPFSALRMACRALGDDACAAEAFRREYQAKYAHITYGYAVEYFDATKVSSSQGGRPQAFRRHRQ